MDRGTPGGRRTFLLAVVGFLLLEAAWALVMPMFRGPDEIGHVYRASAVAEGQWEASGGETPTRVSAEIVADAEDVCREVYTDFRPEVCDVAVDYGDGTVGVASSADKYNPAYYSVVGLPARVLDGAGAAWGMRIVSAIICALLLAWAWVLLTGTARTAFPALALLVACSPAVPFGGAMVAPNGLQYAAGLLLWAGLLVSLRQEAATRAGIVAAGVGGGLLALTHTLGPLWLGGIVLTCLVLAGLRGAWARVRAEPRAWGLAVVGVSLCGLAAAAWVLTASTNAPAAGGEPLSEETKDIGVAPNVILWLLQTVGTMPYRFGLLWPVVYLLWLAPLAAFLVWGWRRARGRSRWAIAFVVVTSAAIPVALTALTYDSLGFAWQGKYGLPLLFGAVLLAGEALDRAAPAVPRAVIWAGVGVLATTHYLCVLCIGLRESSGDFDDGRPWALLLVVSALVVAGAWAALLAAGAARKAPMSGHRSDFVVTTDYFPRKPL